MKKLILLATSFCYLSASAAIAAEAPGAAAASPLQPPTAQGGSAAAAVSEPTAAGEANPTGYTIEELYRRGETLHKKKVAVRGEAVKATSGIMGKNWIHIQDGSGDKAKGNNDIICISAIDQAQVGEVVTVVGTLVFTPASRYKLVIQDATIVRMR